MVDDGNKNSANQAMNERANHMNQPQTWESIIEQNTVNTQLYQNILLELESGTLHVEVLEEKDWRERNMSLIKAFTDDATVWLANTTELLRQSKKGRNDRFNVLFLERMFNVWQKFHNLFLRIDENATVLLQHTLSEWLMSRIKETVQNLKDDVA